jgi:hypothetical protein
MMMMMRGFGYPLHYDVFTESYTGQRLLYVPPHGLILKKFYVLPTQCVYVFCIYLKINGNYFAVQH